MFSLHGTTGVTPGDVLSWSLRLDASPLLVQEVGQAGYQRSEAHDGGGTHHLVVVAAQQVFVILEERLYGPPQGQDVDYRLGIDQGTPPVAHLRQRLVQAVARHQHQRGTEFAYPGPHCMDVDLVSALLRWPSGLYPVGMASARGISTQLDPFPLPLRGTDSHPAIALQPATAVPVSSSGGSPHPPPVTPTVDQEVGMRVWRRLEGGNLGHSQVHLAMKRYAFPFPDRFLSVQPRQQRAAPTQEEGETDKQAVARHHLLLRGRVVSAQAGHLPSFGLAVDRIVEGQITGHEGCLRASPMLGAFSPLATMCRLDGLGHFLSEIRLPSLCDLFGRPRPQSQETRKPREIDLVPHARTQSLQRVPPLVLDQPQQSGHEVLPLTAAEARAEQVQIRAQRVGKAYHRLGHGPPPGQWGISAYHYPHGKGHACYFKLSKCKDSGIKIQPISSSLFISRLFMKFLTRRLYEH